MHLIYDISFLRNKIYVSLVIYHSDNERHETYNILPIIIVSLKHITQYSGHFYFEKALIVNNVFIIDFLYNMN